MCVHNPPCRPEPGRGHVQRDAVGKLVLLGLSRARGEAAGAPGARAVAGRGVGGAGAATMLGLVLCLLTGNGGVVVLQEGVVFGNFCVAGRCAFS